MTDKTEMPSRVGFVVIGRNEGARLVRCLDALPRGAGPVAYVDSGSTDDSVVQATARGAIIVQLDRAQPFTAARARNAGFAALRDGGGAPNFVQFIDGDCEMSPSWLPEAQDFLDANPCVAVVCGRRRERFPDASVYNRLCDIEWNTPLGEAIACGGDALMRADAFAAIGGFDAAMIAGEEPELCARLRGAGWTIWRIDAAMTMHDAAILSLGQWWMRGVRGGFGASQVWAATNDATQRVYRTMVARAAFWAGIMPLAMVLAVGIHPLAGLAVGMLYPLQIGRIAVRRGVARADAWVYGFFAVLAKFPELQGALRYARQARRAGAHGAIFYK